MHFSVLVPVKVNVTDQDHEQVAAATLRREIIAELLSGVDPQDIGKRVSLQVEQEYCNAIHNAFASAVDTAVDKAMEPYSQDTKDPRYCVFEDETENLKAQFEVATVECIQYGTKYYHKHKLHGFKVCKDGIIREVTPDGQEFLSDKAKQMQVVTVSAKEFYKTFRKFAKERSVYCPEKKAWGYYTNPNCFYDWYSIGGRWQAPLLVPIDCEDYALGVSGCGSDGKLPLAPDGYRWTSAARIKDIALDVMVQWQIDEFTEQYKQYAKMWDTQTLSEKPGYYLELKPDGIYSFNRMVFDPTISLEEALASHNYTIDNIISRMMCGYLDTRINPIVDEDGESEYGYYDQDCCEGDWEEAVNDFIAEFDPETVLVIVDCHM